MAIAIIKASGQSEEFHLQKLVDSLIRSGVPEDVALDIAKKVEKQISPATHTKKIYKLAKRMLKQYSHASSMRYSIKKALSSLGPSGYPFERYFARILRENGYAVELNRTFSGYCITHEVDIFASRDDKRFVIECKYHSDGGKPTDVKVALYIHSRFEDIRKAGELLPGHNETVHQGWLVTNTRCTSDAIKYAECAGLRVVSWRYPEHQSLEKMIEAKRLYPVTILSSVKKDSLEALFNSDIVLAQDIAGMDEQSFIRKSGLDANTAGVLKREADELCPCL